jgi:hypothetical protein
MKQSFDADTLGEESQRCNIRQQQQYHYFRHAPCRARQGHCSGAQSVQHVVEAIRALMRHSKHGKLALLNDLRRTGCCGMPEIELQLITNTPVYNKTEMLGSRLLEEQTTSDDQVTVPV